MSVLAVELSELNSYADLVRRAAADCTTMGAEAPFDIPDGDFGRLLELMSRDYEALLPSFHTIMTEDGRRLDHLASALHAVAQDYARTDDHVAHSLGSVSGIAVGDHLSGFDDVAAVSMSCLAPSSVSLPQVHIGFPFDQICELAVRVGLIDIRESITRFITGDLGKALTQAEYWDLFAVNLENVHANLASGVHRIRDTWEGQASDRADAAMRAWLESLADQSDGMHQMGGHLRDLVSEALQVAQLLVDTVRFFLSVVTAGWSYAYLPIYGEIKLVDKIRDAWHLIMDARKVLGMFWGFVRVLAGAIHEAVEVFSTTELPCAPGAAAA